MTTEKEKKSSRLTKALLETANDMRKGAILNEAAYQKITMRHLGNLRAPTEPVTGGDIRALRERARLSQAVFAHLLNVTVGYVSQLERGAKRPTGTALVLLNVIRRKGIEAIL
jgi:putative transcriptional regulator